jgi:hypothetical protein
VEGAAERDRDSGRAAYQGVVALERVELALGQAELGEVISLPRSGIAALAPVGAEPQARAVLEDSEVVVVRAVARVVERAQADLGLEPAQDLAPVAEGERVLEAARAAESGQVREVARAAMEPGPEPAEGTGASAAVVRAARVLEGAVPEREKAEGELVLGEAQAAAVRVVELAAVVRVELAAVAQERVA